MTILPDIKNAKVNVNWVQIEQLENKKIKSSVRNTPHQRAKNLSVLDTSKKKTRGEANSCNKADQTTSSLTQEPNSSNSVNFNN